MGVQADIWRDLASKVVAAAAELHDPQLRVSMLYLAAGYETLAKHADAIEHDFDLQNGSEILDWRVLGE